MSFYAVFVSIKSSACFCDCANVKIIDKMNVIGVRLMCRDDIRQRHSERPALAPRSCSSTMSTNMIRPAVLSATTKTPVTQGAYEDHCLGLGQQPPCFEVEEAESGKKRSWSEFLQPVTPGIQIPCFLSSSRATALNAVAA